GTALAPVFRPLLDHPWVLNPLRLLIAFVLLVIPSTAMGITLPLLTRVLAARDVAFGPILGRLYGWNTLGAMVGVVAGVGFLVGAYGVRGTALIAGTANLIAAAVAAWLWTTQLSDVAALPATAPRRATSGRVVPETAPNDVAVWCAAAFLSGFCLLALEVLWFRFLLLFVKGHSNAFPIMLGVVLAGIALGGLTASLWLRRAPAAHRFAAPLAFLSAAALVLSYASFPSVIAPLGLASITRPAEIVRLGVPLMFPVSYVSGVFFTFLGAVLRTRL